MEAYVQYWVLYDWYDEALEYVMFSLKYLSSNVFSILGKIITATVSHHYC
jgi:hypothetical protein